MTSPRVDVGVLVTRPSGILALTMLVTACGTLGAQSSAQPAPPAAGVTPVAYACPVLRTLRDSVEPHAETFWVQPYLQNPKQSEMTVLWWTHENLGDNEVRFDAANVVAADTRFVPEMGKWVHEATLTGLTPETQYEYRVSSGGVESDEYTFCTARRRDSNIRVHILGDGRTDNDEVIARQRGLVQMSGSADLILELGDIVEYGSTMHWNRFLRRILTASNPGSPGATTGSHVPFHMVIGNHEIADVPVGDDPSTATEADQFADGLWVNSIERFKAIASNPSNAAPEEKWEERYYALDYGAITFLVLDANNTSDPALDNHDHLPPGSTPDWEPGSDQYDWLVGELERARRESVLTIVVSHPSAYSSGVHGTSHKQNDTQRGHELRVFDSLFVANGVDAVISSHDHLMERSLVGDGPLGDHNHELNINHWVVGNSGNGARSAQEGWQEWMSVNGDGRPPYYRQWFYDWAGDSRDLSSMLELYLMKTEAEDGTWDGTWTATFRVHRADGATFDELSIVRTDPIR